MTRRPFITAQTQSVAVGALDFDVVQARKMGIDDDELDLAWETLSTVWRGCIALAARRAGRTEVCPACECHTPPGGCIHCAAGEYVAIPQPAHAQNPPETAHVPATCAERGQKP